MLIIGIVLLAIVLGVLFLRKYAGREPVPAQKPAVSAPQEGVRTVVLFFASPDGSGLVRESREIDPCNGVAECAESVIDELINGPLGDFSPTLPETATYRSVSINGGTLTVDFGRELQDGMPSGSNAEMAAVYSVVDSLAINFPEIKQVRFLVEGAPVETLKGHLDLREPLVPDYSLENNGAAPAVEPAPKRRP
jgi:spore germination protein GerM